MHSLGLVKTQIYRSRPRPRYKNKTFFPTQHFLRCFVFPDIFPTSRPNTKFPTFSRFPDLVGTLDIETPITLVSFTKSLQYSFKWWKIKRRSSCSTRTPAAMIATGSSVKRHRVLRGAQRQSRDYRPQGKIRSNFSHTLCYILISYVKSTTYKVLKF